MSIVIVAIPRDEDEVWKYSTEKIPHMTLLYLGDGPLKDEENVVKYVEHVAKTSLREFGMTKDRRGPLGPDRADVLFFEKGWRNKDLETVRSYLLKNESIAQAYLEAKQFNMWTPHLTMGYPTNPAKTLENPWQLGYIQFDRIAIWFGDSEGPEFPLRKQFDDIDYVEPSMYQSAPDENALAHAQEEAPPTALELLMENVLAHADLHDDELELLHFGTKGMKWGVRRRTDSSGRVVGPAPGANDGVSKALESVKKSQSSSDHKKAVNAALKGADALSTDEIREVTARLKAVKEFNQTTAQIQQENRGRASKLTSWALGAVTSGLSSHAEAYVKEWTGDIFRGIAPKTPTSAKKDAKEAFEIEKQAKKIAKEKFDAAETLRKEAREDKLRAEDHHRDDTKAQREAEDKARAAEIAEHERLVKELTEEILKGG